jgi:hypothetical protein
MFKKIFSSGKGMWFVLRKVLMMCKVLELRLSVMTEDDCNRSGVELKCCILEILEKFTETKGQNNRAD